MWLCLIFSFALGAIMGSCLCIFKYNKSIDKLIDSLEDKEEKIKDETIGGTTTPLWGSVINKEKRP